MIKKMLGRGRTLDQPHVIAPNFHPYYVTGFTDGEGCFSVTITEHK
jgi:hypothetical protein